MNKLTIQSLAAKKFNWIDSYNPKFITINEFNQLVPDTSKGYFVKDTEFCGNYEYQDRAYHIDNLMLVVSFKSLKNKNNFVLCTNFPKHEGLVKYEIYKKYITSKTVYKKIA